MSTHTVGWVLDKDTSQRRIHVFLVDLLGHPHAVGLTVEVYGQSSLVVWLDAEGASYLQGLLGEAVKRVAGEKAS